MSTTVTAVATAAGTTTLSTAAVHLIQTKQRQTNLAVQLAEIPRVTVKQMRANGSNNRAIGRPAARAIEGQTVRELQIAAATAQARAAWIQTGAEAVTAAATAQVRAAWIQTGAEAAIASEIEAYRRVRVVAGRVAPLVVLPVVRVAPVPAVRGVPQAWEVPVVAVVAVVAVVGDGGN
jgi:hypothetical protein